jgi:hypothetical protein
VSGEVAHVHLARKRGGSHGRACAALHGGLAHAASASKAVACTGMEPTRTCDALDGELAHTAR